MPIDAITQRIIEDAQKEAESIKAQVIEQVRQIEADTRREADSIRQDILAKAKEEAHREEEKRKIAANLERRKAILEEKQSAISLVFDTALKKIQELDKAKYQSLVENMFLDCEGDEEVIVPPGEKRIDEEFIEKINKLLSKKRKKGNLKLSREKRDIPGGGFILRKGRVEKNNSFRVFMGSMKEKLDAKVAGILFG